MFHFCINDCENSVNKKVFEKEISKNTEEYSILLYKGHPPSKKVSFW